MRAKFFAVSSSIFISLALSVGHAGKLGSNEFSFRNSCQGADVSAVLAFNGDVLTHDDMYKAAVRKGKRSFSFIWEKTNPLIRKADFAVANLEGPAALGLRSDGKDLGDVGFIYDALRDPKGGKTPPAVYSGTNMRFNFHPVIFQDLKASGYDLLTTANNHAMDRRSDGIDKTIAAALAVGMPIVGTKSSREQSAQLYTVQNINGLNVAFISCTQGLNGFKDEKSQVLKCYAQSDKIVNMISTLSKHPAVDAVIVLPHWGTEYADDPNESQMSYARKFLDAGATAVIGGHPHVMEPWEKYITKDGRETLILYSLGNFVACQLGTKRSTGVIAYLGLAKRNGEKFISGVGYTATKRMDHQIEIVPADLTKDSQRKQLMEYNFGAINYIAPNQSLSRLCK